MIQLIASNPKKNGFMRPLAELRDFIVNTQYDWSRRTFITRTIDADGYIAIKADTYSPAMLAELLVYTLTAERLSGVPIISLAQIVAIDAKWSMYGFHPPFTALRLYLQVMDEGLFRKAPPTLPFPKTPTPDLGRIYVGQPWESIGGPSSLGGLRDIELELHGEACGLDMKVLNNGNLVLDHESDGEFSVDEEAAADFITFLAEDFIRDHCRDDHPDWAYGYMTYLRHGTLAIAKGQSRNADEILRRTRWRQACNLHGQRTQQELVARLDVRHATTAELEFS